MTRIIRKMKKENMNQINLKNDVFSHYNLLLDVIFDMIEM
jgi:hypothetical protein